MDSNRRVLNARASADARHSATDRGDCRAQHRDGSVGRRAVAKIGGIKDRPLAARRSPRLLPTGHETFIDRSVLWFQGGATVADARHGGDGSGMVIVSMTMKTDPQ
jgi:hypothetical protein